MAIVEQSDWGGGIYRGRKAPAGSVYDAVNALVNDEGLLFRRGGAPFYSDIGGGGTTLTRLAALYYPGLSASRVTSASPTSFYAYNGTTPTLITASLPAAPSRWASIAGMAVAAIGPSRLLVYGGSLKTANYTTGTATVTLGSETVTGTGTAWLANVDPGMILWRSGRAVVVKAVVSDTQLTLTAPYPDATATGAYTLTPLMDTTTFSLIYTPPALGGTSYTATAGAGTPRLILTTGNRAYPSEVGNPHSFDKNTYQELPSQAVITGAEGVGDEVILFTTAGVWKISNLSLDAVDDSGNVQWPLLQLSKDLILWGDTGVAAWAGGVIVPAFDDVFILSPDGPMQPISGSRTRTDGGIRSLYRSYVSAGYTPGRATVHRGHYWLPIVSGTTVIDVLVCRLDRGFAWTRWAGGAAGTAYTAWRTDTGAPRLLGTSGQRVTDCTTCLDATGNTIDLGIATSIPTFTVIPGDFDMGDPPATVRQANLTYELTTSATAYPATVDDFDRPDEVPVGTPYLGWTNTAKPSLTSGVLVSPAASNSDLTVPDLIGPDCFAEILTAGTMTSGTAALGLRLSDHSAAATGYMAYWSTAAAPTLQFAIFKMPARTQLAVTTLGYTSIGGMRFTCVAGTLTVYNLQSGAWTQVLQTTDATYPAAGYPGVLVNHPATVGAIDTILWGPATASIPAALADPPRLTVAYSSDRDAGAFTTIRNHGVRGSSDAGAATSDGSAYRWWMIGKRRNRLRVRIQCASPVTSLVLRSLQLLIRDQ